MTLLNSLRHLARAGSGSAPRRVTGIVCPPCRTALRLAGRYWAGSAPGHRVCTPCRRTSLRPRGSGSAPRRATGCAPRAGRRLRSSGLGRAPRRATGYATRAGRRLRLRVWARHRAGPQGMHPVPVGASALRVRVGLGSAAGRRGACPCAGRRFRPVGCRVGLGSAASVSQ